MSTRPDLQIVPLAFGGYTLCCLCRSNGQTKQQCWTLQTDSADSQSLPENVMDDIGLEIWESSRVLCEYVLQSNSLRRFITSVSGILELGAGVGLPSMLCAALGAKAVTLTDYDPQVVNIESENLKLNGLSGTACQLDWRDRDAAARLGKFDLILCADLLYASATVKDFMETVEVVLSPPGIMLFAHQIRRAITWDKALGVPRLEESDAPLELFKAKAKEAGLMHRELLLKEPSQHAKDMGTEGSFLVLAFAWNGDALKCL